MRNLILSSAFLSIWVAGCGGGPDIVPVSGKVTIDGQPLTKGVIQVIAEGYRPAMGDIQADGSFTLTTEKPNDGCVRGTHKVAIIGDETLGPASRKWHAPPDYADFVKSGLTLTVDKPTKDARFELSWKGGKPYVEKFNKE